MYFRLKIQRSSILIGSDIIIRNRNAVDVVARPRPASRSSVLNQRFAEQHRQREDVEQHEQDAEDLAHEPVASAAPCRAPRTQMYSDRLTLVSASSLWMSQNSNGPKKFQFGPRRNVPSTISEHPQDHEPEQEDVISAFRSLNV